MLGEQIQRAKKFSNIYKPEFYDVKNSDDRARFEILLQSPLISVFDELYGQLRELIKSRNPTLKLSEIDYQTKIAAHVGDCPMEEYGVWVFYPWSGRLVHLLDKEEFVELRTAANRNKITTAERDILANKKVGVIGLSVGQSVSVTLALERGCGELRLADFDTLELNNLNRIRSGVHNLGILKAYMVAREIAEIDPYFKVICYTEGVNQENIYDFFTNGGKLDAVIDECDGVNIKILCRIVAKELHIPVLMEASDRGTMDIERFDLEPGRPIIHGWLEHLPVDFEVLNKLKTSEEKLPYLLPIAGLDTISPRMKASMVEIEQTLTTWPQLATAVTLGGAITADTCRRMFLGQFTNSGRYFIDMEQLVPDTRHKEPFVPKRPSVPAVSEDLMKQLADEATVQLALLSGGSQLPKEVITGLVASAVSAPTAGNNQPWKWYVRNNCIFLFHEKIRSASFGDFKDMASHVGLGAAIENLVLDATNKNIGTKVHIFPLRGSWQLVAVIELREQVAIDGLFRPAELVRFMDKRATNRRMGLRKQIDSAVYEQLMAAVSSVPGAELIIKNDPADLDELANILGAAERLRLLHLEGHHEFYQKELRWTSDQSKETADGIDLATVEITLSEEVGLKLVNDPDVITLLAEWGGGKGLERVTRKSVAAASAIGLITMPAFSPENFVAGGRAMERMWLTAAENGIALQPMVSAILHFARLNFGNAEGMPKFMKDEFEVLYTRFEKLYPNIKGKAEVFLFRLSIVAEPDVKSYRIPVENVLSFS